MNVIYNNKQDVYVPWLICMDSNEANISLCDSQVGIEKPNSSASAAVLQRFLDADLLQDQTPTVYVNGKTVETSYSAVHQALCSADPSLSGCSAEMPNDADKVITDFCVRPPSIQV